MITKGSDHTNPHNAVDAISASHILHTHRHFDHPEEVVSARLSTDEKREILAWWLLTFTRSNPCRNCAIRRASTIQFDTGTYSTH